jgi:hypothetical protein
MYMNGVPVCTLMLIGRWSSDAFLRYIRPQVEEFGSNVAQRMISNPVWHHVPDPDFNDPRLHRATTGRGTTRGLGQNGLPVVHAAFDPWGEGMANAVVPVAPPPQQQQPPTHQQHPAQQRPALFPSNPSSR